ncbi:MAG: permease [Clostridia bacterium]|nr:MAG: permease [Clostridia bacterium]
MAFDLVVLALYPQAGVTVFRKTASNFLQMLSVLPPIFILLGLLEVWVPREAIIRFVGEGSGLVGIVLSLFLGAAAAGPLYGAFPVAATMLRKGAKFSNVMVLLYSWSTLKLPMFLFETSALGAQFSVTRMLINIPGVIVMAWLTSRLIPYAEQEAIYQKHLLTTTT